MAARLWVIGLLPLFSGCIVVQHRESLIDLGRFAGPLSDSNLVGRLLLIAACCGLLGGVVTWLGARSFSAWRGRS